FDNDGRPDLLVVSVGDRARLYRNVAPGGHWVGVRVTDPAKGNRDLLGTVVRVTAGGRTWVQVAQSASSYLSASDPRPLFGLGGAAPHDRRAGARARRGAGGGACGGAGPGGGGASPRVGGSRHPPPPPPRPGGFGPRPPPPPPFGAPPPAGGAPPRRSRTS